ncbi:hypothetical protein [Micromonospora sp. HUAS LYJ1]|uniref:hypothetical protein n=1 Tax=Micromonospora sp. HUAS LYJ1 TaxID=3061626 RepID=UPI0026729204|nr:hypothetical protein [Micromonospora sp. HUAS LYJ1]WKU07978.1 hypothetical protein Q2K16_13595 [Micromonospora sp. HUAS LYJ1]
MTTTDPTALDLDAPTVGGDIDLAGWYADTTADYRDYEERQPADGDRDRAIVEWVTRVLGNPADADSRAVLAFLAARHHDEVVPSGTVDWLKGRVAELTADVDRLREQVFAQQPVIDAVQAWAEAHEDGDLVLRIRRPSARAEAAAR